MRIERVVGVVRMPVSRISPRLLYQGVIMVEAHAFSTCQLGSHLTIASIENQILDRLGTLPHVYALGKNIFVIAFSLLIVVHLLTYVLVYTCINGGAPALQLIIGE